MKVGHNAEASARIYRRHASISFTRLAGQGLLVIPEGAQQVVLNEQGLRVLELLDGQRRVDELARLLADEYDAEPAEVIQDVLDLLEDLRSRGAVLGPQD